MEPELKTRPKKRIALVIQYVGTHFNGWQRQTKQRTVQEEIEKVLQSILKHPVTVYAAGRTDTGVHAAGQVIHFDTNSSIPAEKWAVILNTRLPKDIIALASAEVDFNWHARFSASWRRYRYTLYNAPEPNLFVRPFTWHYYYAPLDESLIQKALDPLIGHHHLAAFHRAGSQRKHSWVEVQAAECHRQGPFVEIEIQANGFLYGMMRLIVGLLVQVGRQQRSLLDFHDLWRNERREQVKYAAPACGLCLLRVGYPETPFPPEIWCNTMPRFLFSSLYNNYSLTSERLTTPDK